MDDNMHWAMIFFVVLSFSAMSAVSATSDERTETLADIRQSLTAVHGEINKPVSYTHLTLPTKA